MWRMMIIAILAIAASASAVNYPTEAWPATATIDALNGTTDSLTGLPYISSGTKPTSTPTLMQQIDRQFQRRNLLLAAIGAARVVKVDDTHIGVFPSRYHLRGTNYYYPGQSSVAIASDDTWYVYLDSDSDEGGGADVTIATDLAGWPADTTTFIPLAEVTMASSVITTITDVRNRRRYATWQPYGAALAAIEALAKTDSNFIVGNGTTWVAETGATARASLGLTIGTHVQAWDADLDTIGGLAKTDSNFIVGNGSAWVAETGTTVRTSLGLAIGTNVEAWDNDLDDIAALTPTDSYFMVGDGTDWVTETGATARASLELTIGTHVQAYDADLTSIAALSTTGILAERTGANTWAAVTVTTAGKAILDDAAASDQRTTLGLGTIATQAANNVAITGGAISGITDLAVADGGTGASDAETARTNLSAAAASHTHSLTDITDEGALASKSEVAATDLAAAVQDVIPQASVTAGTQAAQVRAITVQVKDAAANVLAQRFAVQLWLAATDFGAPDATGNAVAITTGTALQTVTAHAHYTVISDANGAVVFDLTVAAGGSRYVLAEVDGRIYSSGEVEFTAP